MVHCCFDDLMKPSTHACITTLKFQIKLDFKFPNELRRCGWTDNETLRITEITNSIIPASLITIKISSLII